MIKTTEQIKNEIALEKNQLAMWKGKMDQSEIDWINAKISDLKAMLPQARYNDKVLAYGWKSVERNA
jgi:flagellar biosynthesis chaperone FliJ